MKTRIFLLILLTLTTLCFAVERKYYDCNDKLITHERDPFLDTNIFPYNDVEMWDIALKNSLTDEVINCLPETWKNRINTFKKYVAFKIVLCGATDCGNSKDFKIILPKTNDVSKCQCAESTMLHEIIHVAADVDESDDNDKRIRGCEKKCLKNIKSCQDNPPRGKEEDCCPD